MQVAVKHMPVQSRVLGVDLVPIAPVSGAHSFPGDITAADTRKRIGEFFGKDKCDVVLHDGAPNMGTNWDYDAYQQNELTLKALKLATFFLRRHGTFVTKIFRSKDYNSLQFVLQKFFGKVTATKPNASRNESAEIFVVCQNYLAPHAIDEKMLDPKYIFSEVEKEKGKCIIPPNVFGKRARRFPPNAFGNMLIFFFFS
jgi:AdoMet-dependent rRNA methyltransferase SPB1